MSTCTGRNSLHLLFILISLHFTFNFVQCAPKRLEQRYATLDNSLVKTQFSIPINVSEIAKPKVIYREDKRPNTLPLKLLNVHKFRIFQNFHNLLRKKRSVPSILDVDLRLRQENKYPYNSSVLAVKGDAMANSVSKNGFNSISNATTRSGGNALARALAKANGSSNAAAQALNGGNAMAMAKSSGNSTSAALSNGGGHSFAASESGGTGHAKATAITGAGLSQSRAEAGALNGEIVATAIKSANKNDSNGNDGYFEGHDSSFDGDIFQVPMFGDVQKGQLFNDHFNDLMPTTKPPKVTEMPDFGKSGGDGADEEISTTDASTRPKSMFQGGRTLGGDVANEEIPSTTEASERPKSMFQGGRTLGGDGAVEEISTTEASERPKSMFQGGRTLDGDAADEEIPRTTEESERPKSMLQGGRTLGGDAADEEIPRTTEESEKPKSMFQGGRSLGGDGVDEEISTTEESTRPKSMFQGGRTLGGDGADEEISTAAPSDRPKSMFQGGRTLSGNGADEISASTNAVITTTKKPRKVKTKTKCCRIWLIMLAKK